MKLPTSLVAVKKISSNVARSSFPTEEIEKAARLIIDVEGTINPIILRRTSLESYEVINGHFEYYAAVRAREISPLKGEMIQAIILEPENEDTLLEQVNLFREAPAPISPPNGNGSDLESRFSNLEKIFQLQFEELRKDNRILKQSIDAVNSKGQNSGFGEELINAIVEKVVEAVRLTAPRSRSSKKSLDELRENPIDLNSASEKDLCDVSGIAAARAQTIIQARENKGGFTRVEELTDIPGISKKMFIQYHWGECFTVNNSDA